MKIITLLRTLNEERNIYKFLQQYSHFSDEIIISDSGSTDRTVEMIKGWAALPGTKITLLEDFPVKIEGDGISYTHEPVQINMLIRTAKEHGADWIIYDDCDCWPNRTLKENARSIFLNAEIQDTVQIFAYRLYVVGNDFYLPLMNHPGKSLWAWKPSASDIVCSEENPKESNFRVPSAKKEELEHPFVLLHNFMQDKEHFEKKWEFYNKKGIPQTNPLRGGAWGHLEFLPTYAKEL